MGFIFKSGWSIRQCLKDCLSSGPLRSNDCGGDIAKGGDVIHGVFAGSRAVQPVSDYRVESHIGISVKIAGHYKPGGMRRLTTLCQLCMILDFVLLGILIIINT
jgi:hypothetical protein